MDQPGWINTEKGVGLTIAPVKELLMVKGCGCWIINLAHGVGVLMCPVHEQPVLNLVHKVPVLPT